MTPKALLIRLALWLVKRWAQEHLPERVVEKVVERIVHKVVEVPGPERVVEKLVEVPVTTIKERHILVPTNIPVEPKLLKAAEDLVRLIEVKFPASDHSGEFRAHQAYAVLMKAFPKAEKSDIRLAIELAVRTVKASA